MLRLRKARTSSDVASPGLRGRAQNGATGSFRLTPDKRDSLHFLKAKTSVKSHHVTAQIAGILNRN